MFPDFRHDQTLRFSRLFGIKNSLKFKKWKAVKKNKQRGGDPSKQLERSESVVSTASEPGTPVELGDSLMREAAAENKFSSVGPDGEWRFNLAPLPDDPSAYVEDQAVRFHKPAEEKKSTEDQEKDEKNK